ncbi:hypothetical protein [Erythrobacter tepidarius]|uniref:hypothetical protein n=1 Tax=Erythrobacter tepidarius TaxID=60454 RepID=UPI000A3908D7|nr:hypothetical protein [Erythrobacter tepidarius]
MTSYSPTNEWNELEAAMRSEVELARIMREGADKVTARELELTRRDALRAMVTGLPDPRDVARTLETADPEAAEVLKQAWISSKQPYAGAWRVADCEHTAVLRAMGLVGWIGKERGMGCAVGSFGLLVRKVMLFDFDSQQGEV